VVGVTERVAAPRWLAEHAEAFRASGAAPAVPRLAATVILLRPTGSGEPDIKRFEIYVQRRAATMAFAPGMYAFPGGSVDAADYASTEGDDVASPDLPDVRLASFAEFATRLALPEDSAHAVLRAAVRELAEETGVRLPVAAMVPWARWLTPEFEPRRFDTFFFVAGMPADQETTAQSGESDHVAWLTPGEALGLRMLPPTRRVVEELGGYSDVDTVLAAARLRTVSVPVQPVVEVDADGVWLRLA
jgi:8-oxo-dGTP pyrophosphatase MutT (NUDIX family)